MMKYLLFYTLILTSSFSAIFGEKSLYDVLGIQKTASLKQIKQAYKNLAKEWHPDKNKSPEAADVFTKINEAYETLGDTEKRRQYDQFGYTSAQEQQRPRHPNFHGGFGHFDPFSTFDSFFGGGFHHRESIIDKYNINFRIFESKMLPESYQKPTLLYVYTDFCFECRKMEHHIEKAIKDLEELGLGVGTFHANRVPGLTSKLRIQRVPTLLGVVNGKPTYYRNTYVSHEQLREFIRGFFPRKTLEMLDDNNIGSFLAGYQDNFVRAILIGQKPEPSLRFLAAAFYFKDFVKFGYVYAKSEKIEKFVKKFGVNRHRETLFMFNEELSSPVATITMQQLPRKTLDEVIENNKFLILPRLSSQQRFEELCPAVRSPKRRRLCVVLITSQDESKDHEKFRETLRKFIQKSPNLMSDRVRFAYVYEETQKKVISALENKLSEEEKPEKDTLQIVILWHMENHHLSYEWLQSGWTSDPGRLEEYEEHLEDKVRLLLNSDQSLPYKVLLPEFHNEHALGLMLRIVYRLYDWAERVYNYILSYDTMTVMTFALMIFMMFFMTYFMQKMGDAEEEQISKTMPKKTKPRPPSTTVNNKTVNLYEINYKSYDDYVVNADTGLTFTILVDDDTKDMLLTKFGHLIYPYTRYSALTFAYINLTTYHGWFRHLLEESLDKKIQLDNIIIRNCIGTVLALNGFRKYYYMYQPKRALKWMKQKGNSSLSQAIGFSDSESSDSDTDVNMEVDDVLVGLVQWIDRVFDGSARKIRIPVWPEMAFK